MKWGWLLFSFEGRANRAKFWLVLVILLVLGWIVTTIVSATTAAPMISQMKAAMQKCQTITDPPARQQCINQNMPVNKEAAAAQEKCEQLATQKEVYNCNQQALQKVQKNFFSIFSKIMVYAIPLYLFDLWVGLAINIKRLHDLDKSGWFSLLMFIPFVNIGVIIWLGFFIGTTGANKYGADPLQSNVVV